MATIEVNPFRGIIGLPPRSHISDDEIINSMPILKITPGKPYRSEGITVFRIKPDWNLYGDILGNNGYKIGAQPIRIAYLADNFPTDSFTNEYSETFLQNITQAASSGMSQVSQMLGSRTIGEGAQTLINEIAGLGSAVGGFTGDIITGGANMMQSGMATANKFMKTMEESGGGQGILASGAKTVGELLAGHRIDFPKVWVNSGYEPSYTITVRLYNPFPGNNDALKKYIIGPLAVILTLGLPIDQDPSSGAAYSWPFFHKIVSDGIFDLNPGIITNITVIKGGDQQQISHAQTMGIVDVRIDFGSVYSSMFSEAGKPYVKERPTLYNYLNAMERKFEPYTRTSLQIDSALAAGAVNASARRNIVDEIENQVRIDKGVSARQGVTAPSPTSITRSPTITLEEELLSETQAGVGV